MDSCFLIVISFLAATCPDPQLPTNTRFLRHSDTEGSVVCDVTEESRTLSCLEGEWEKVDVKTLCKTGEQDSNNFQVEHNAQLRMERASLL